tara:strand:- start:1257 stop:1448 length:192 start_codon:yes stop_codon:yes gene_type:complete
MRFSVLLRTLKTVVVANVPLAAAAYATFGAGISNLTFYRSDAPSGLYGRLYNILHPNFLNIKI